MENSGYEQVKNKYMTAEAGAFLYLAMFEAKSKPLKNSVPHFWILKTDTSGGEQGIKNFNEEDT